VRPWGIESVSRLAKDRQTGKKYTPSDAIRQKRAVPTALARERHSRTVRIDHSRRPFEERNSTTAGALDPLRPTVCSGVGCA